MNPPARVGKKADPKQSYIRWIASKSRRRQKGLKRRGLEAPISA